MTGRLISRVLLWAAAGVAAAGLGLPLVNANRFRNQIRDAMERALGGRKVEIGQVTLRLLPAPGFYAENVILGEDPAFGVEHFAYMRAMQMGLRLRALWTGRVELASLTLVEPSINLVKNEAGRWNFETLLGRGAAPAGVYFPYIGVDDGRVNFKIGDTKAAFYLQEVEAALSPPRDTGGRWRLRFAGRPARTGRVLSGMGWARGDGYLTTGAASSVSFDLELEPSPMGHLVGLLQGHDSGIHGVLGARIQLRGPLERMRLEGTLRTEDVHRWDILPTGAGAFLVPLAGWLDLPGQALEMESRLEGPRTGRLRAGLQVRNYLGAPEWRATVELEKVPAGPLFQVAQHLGAPAPPGFVVRGLLSGAVELSGSAWPQGSLQLEDGVLSWGQAPPIEFRTIQARLDGPRFEMGPAEVRIGDEIIEASASGRLDQRSIEGRFTARSLDVARLRRPAETLGIPWLHALQAGRWDGQVSYQKRTDLPGVWSGTGTLSQASWQPEGFQSPVGIARARVRWEGASLQLDALSGSLGEMQFSGSYRRRLEGPDSVNLRLARVDLAHLDPWLKPEQRASRWAIWRRVLGRTTPQASTWLKSARVEGPVRVDALDLAGWSFRDVRSTLAWNGERLLLRGLRAALGGGSLTGTLEAEFSGAAPQYSFQAAATGLDLKELSESSALFEGLRRGTLDGRLKLVAAGRTAQDLRAALKASGTFEARAMTLAGIEGNPDGSLEVRSMRGVFELVRGGAELRDVRLVLARESPEALASIGGGSRMLFDGKQFLPVEENRPATP